MISPKFDSQIIFHRNQHHYDKSTEMLRIVPTKDGFDVVIPEHVTLTEAAQNFIDVVNEMLGKAKAAN